MTPDTVEFFPLSFYWWFYLGFTVLVAAMLAFDLGLLHRKAREITLREATIGSVVWIVIALLFNYAFYAYAAWWFPQDQRLMSIPGFDPSAAARSVGLEFLAGYLVERALSIDNIFIFVLVFEYFNIPQRFQHKVLYYGIGGAFVFRAIFVGLGSMLMQYHWVVILFGALLILTGVRMAFGGETKVDPEKNLAIRMLRRWMPVTTDLHRERFLITIDGVRHATPLLVALVFLEFTDIVFAIDSVPAIFALTKEPMIVFTSNIFAILGLRAMYFMLAGAMDKFYLLKYALAIVLVFVGLKMVWLNQVFGGHFPIGLSLGIISGVLIASVVASLLFPRKPKSAPPKHEHRIETAERERV